MKKWIIRYLDEITLSCLGDWYLWETWADGVTRLVHPADEELQADDGVDDDDEHHQHTDVEKGDHGFHDGVQHNL